MVFTSFPATVFAAEGDAAPGTSGIEKPTRTITAFDELGEGFEKSVPFDGHTYAVTVKLGTPIEEIVLPTELGVTVEKTTTTATPPAKDEVVDSGEAPKDTAPAVEPTSSEPTAEQTAEPDTTVSGNAPATPSDTEEEPVPEDKPDAEKIPAPEQESSVTTVTEETIPVTWKGDREYNPAQNGKVIYTAVLPEGYVLKDGIVPPTINVMVGRQAMARTAKAVTEQFSLPIGQTYYFDLSGEAGNIGTINTAVPDTTLHYVPFTYAGTVNAYSLDSSSSGNENASTKATPSDRSLFVADYTISHTISWNDLNTANLIFGKTFDENYKLRTLSGGSDKSGSSSDGSDHKGIPNNNEWDSILSKSGLTNPIKNWKDISSWGQDTCCTSEAHRALRGYSSAAYWIYSAATNNGPDSGWRPALEVLSPATLGTDGLKAVELNLNGGHLGTDTSVTSMNIVYTGSSYTASDATNLTRPTGNTDTYFKWNTVANGSGTSYAVGASVPDSVTTLYAQWAVPTTPAITFDARNGDTIADVEVGDSMTLPADPTWAGYTFDGWYDGIDGTDAAGGLDGKLDLTKAKALTASTTVYAKWTKGTKTVRTETLDLTGSVTPAPDQGWTWDADSSTLTLSGANIEGDKKAYKIDSLDNYLGVYLPSGATINLADNTENSIRSADIIGQFTMSISIYGSGGLTISGTGKLTATGGAAGAMPYGIQAVGTLTIKAATLYATSGKLIGEANGGCIGIYAKGIFIQNGATVHSTSGDVKVDGYANSYAILSSSGLTVSDGILTATAGTIIKGSTGFSDSIGISAPITLTKGEISASGHNKAVDGLITATDATVTGAQETFNSGTTTSLTQKDTATPVVISFGPSISVGAQTGTATYGTAASSTFAVTSNNFGGITFAPSVVWTSGSAPTGVTATISGGTVTINTTAATPAGDYKFKVVSPKASPETGNYESAEATLKVDQLEATITWTGDSFPYNGEVQAPTATITNKVGTDVVTVTVTGGQTAVGNYNATANGFDGAAKDNYKLPSPAPTQVFAITKAAYTGAQTVAPDKTPKSKTHDTITLNDVTPPDGEAVEYGITKPDGTTIWQDSTIFSGLNPDTEYKFKTRVKGNNNHDAGDTSAETTIKTDMTDLQKVTAAKTAVENALNNFTPTNATDADAVIAAVNKALSDAGITGVTPSWDASDAFNKTEATEDATGSVTGKIKLTCGSESDTVTLNKTIAQLPSDPVEKVRLVKAAIEAALNAYTATNSTTADDIKAIVDKANTDSGVKTVTVTWKTPSDFNNKNSTNAENGKVTGTFDLSCTSGGSTKTDTVLVNCPIERTDAQKLADAKAKVEAALNKFIATNATTDADVLAVLTNALSGTGATAAWKSDPNGFSKTLADESKTGKIAGTIVVTFNGTSDVNVDLTIARLVADKTGLNTVIADATNAKNGISTNNSAPSSVPSGTKYVSDTEMKALTDAIAAAQAVASDTNATTTEVNAAITTLNNAVNAFKAAIKTGTYTSGGGSGNTGDSSSDGGNTTTPPTVVTPDPTDPAPPTTVKTEVSATVDNNGNASVTVSDKTMQNAINKAIAEAKKNGTSGNGIAVVIHATTGGRDANTVKVNLPKTVQEQVMANNVLNTVLVVDRPDISINMNLATITEINRQAKADVQLSATRMDSSRLSGEAKKAIAGRPTFDLRATYANGSKSISNFGKGSVTVEIPYVLQKGEVAGGLYAVYVEDNGKKASYIPNSSYDAEAMVMRLATNHFSVYGIGYKAPTSFTDIANHWAKTDIEFVVNRGLFSGTSNTTFSPNSAMTRGMFVTALGRMANADVSSYKKSSFSDVKTDAYYMGYIEWANKNGIVKGIGDGKFAPDQSITREQMAVIIESYAKAIGYALPSVHAEKAFADSVKIGAWAKDSVKKVQMAGVISGKSSNVFDPQGTATRAEASAMLHRFIELVISTDTAQGWMMNDSGKWMYYENGKAVTGKKKIGGETYTFNQYGEMAEAPKNLTYGSYTVKNGDSFWKIAKEQKCNMFELARINGKTVLSMIHPGDVLQIPQQ